MHDEESECRQCIRDESASRSNKPIRVSPFCGHTLASRGFARSRRNIIIPYDISKLTMEQQAIVKRGMQRWMDTGAQISFVPRTNQEEYVFFTGNLTNGNNTTLAGYKKGTRVDVNITAFWWRQEEWMIVHELGHVL